MRRMSTTTLIIMVIGSVVAAAPAGAAEIVVINYDGPAEGFNDASTPAADAGCPTGMTLGQCRLHAFTAVADHWGSLLESSVQIRIGAEFNPLPCDVPGTGEAATIYRDFPGSPYPGTWYPGALADALAGTDLNPGVVDIYAVFNSDFDTATCTENWWYGLDGIFPGLLIVGNDPNARHLFSVALHQVAHGLGFDNWVDESTGQLHGGYPDIYSRFTYDATVGLHWHEMTNAERVASAINTGQVMLDGPENKSDADGFLTGDTVNVVINDGAAAGTYVAEGALFGASWIHTDGFTELLEEANDGSGASPTDGCEPIVGFTPGRIAMIDRGTCEFGLKALHAQSAGAHGVVIANNIAGTLAMAPGEVGRRVEIPVVLMTQTDASTIRPTLPASASYAVVDVHGMHASGFPLLDARNPLVAEKSITHYDPTVGPNSLMEETVASDVGHDLDMTLGLLRDVGWESAGPPPVDQGLTGFDGGAQYNTYYGGEIGDVLGYRFTVNAPIEVYQLGVWNADVAAGGEGLSSPHRVGLWNSSGELMTSNTVYPATGTEVGDWTYARALSAVLFPGSTYTVGAMYGGTDRDSYISSAASVYSHPFVTWVESTYPEAINLGFTYPALSSPSFGRFGPNFLFVEPMVIFVDGFESGSTSAW